jgi:hypothetical protein
LLTEAGRFRVLAVRDVVQTIYGGDERAAQTDLRFLRDREVIRVDSVATRNDGRWLPPQRIEVVTLTKQGLRLAHETGRFPSEQKLYHGLVKPREAGAFSGAAGGDGWIGLGLRRQKSFFRLLAHDDAFVVKGQSGPWKALAFLSNASLARRMRSTISSESS